MPKASLNQTTMGAGELAPRAQGREDTENYFQGLKKCENFLLTPFGGAERVPGTMYAWTAKYANKRCRLIEFVYSANDAYIIEMGEKYFRFGKGNGQLALTDATAWVTGTGYAVGDFVKESSTIYYCVESHTSGVFATDLAADKWVEQSIYEVPTPYQEDELRQVHYVTTGDIGYFANENHPVYKISRFGDVNWTFEELDYIYPPFYPTNTISSKTMSPSATTGNITITSSVNYFDSSVVGSYIQISSGGSVGYAKVTGYTNAKTVSATVIKAFGATTASDNWNISIGEFAGYPDTVVFHDQRLFMMNRITIWGSRTGSFEDFELGDSADYGIRITLASNNVNDGVWLDSIRELAIGTIGGCFIASNVSDATAIPNVRKQNAYGSAAIQPKKISSYTYFATKNNKKIREIVYNFDLDGYQAVDVTLLSEHILGSGVEELAYQQEPYNIMWCLREDGEIAGMNREPEQNVLGWFRVKEDLRTEDKYESVAVVPSDEEDRVWFAVKRKVNGSFVRYIEYMTPINFETKDDCFFVRSGLEYNGASTTTLSGLDHLEGEEVCVFSDGAVQPCLTVENGSVTLTNAVTRAVIGLNYSSTLVTLNIARGSAIGTSQSKKKRVYEAILRFYRTISGKIGIEGSSLDTIPFRNTQDPMGESSPLFSGDKIIPIRGGWDREWNIEIKQDLPLPMTITNIITNVVVNDR